MTPSRGGYGCSTAVPLDSIASLGRLHALLQPRHKRVSNRFCNFQVNNLRSCNRNKPTETFKAAEIGTCYARTFGRQNFLRENSRRSSVHVACFVEEHLFLRTNAKRNLLNTVHPDSSQKRLGVIWNSFFGIQREPKSHLPYANSLVQQKTRVASTQIASKISELKLLVSIKGVFAVTDLSWVKPSSVSYLLGGLQ